MCISNENMGAIRTFAQTAEEYCSFIDSLAERKPDNLYAKLELLLAKLHVAILTVRENSTGEANDKYKELNMTTDGFMILLKKISPILSAESDELKKWHLSFYEDKDKADEYSEAVLRAANLDCDLAELYWDLHDGLVRWNLQTEEAIDTAAYEWRLNFELHWGNHLVNAQQSVHEILYNI